MFANLRRTRTVTDERLKRLQSNIAASPFNAVVSELADALGARAEMAFESKSETSATQMWKVTWTPGMNSRPQHFEILAFEFDKGLELVIRYGENGDEQQRFPASELTNEAKLEQIFTAAYRNPITRR